MRASPPPLLLLAAMVACRGATRVAVEGARPAVGETASEGDSGVSGGSEGDTGDGNPLGLQVGDPIVRVAESGEPTTGTDVVEWLDAVYLDDEHVLLCGQGGLQVSDAATAEPLARLDVPRGYRLDAEAGLAIVGTRDGPLLFVDVSDPYAPKIERDLMMGASYHEGVDIDAGRVLVAWQEQGSVLLDLDGNLLGHIPGSDAYAVALRADRALIGDGDQLVLVDVGEPAVPVVLDRLPLAGEARDIAWEGGRVVVAMGGSGTAVIELADDVLQRRADLALPGASYGAALDGDHAWIAAWDSVALIWVGEGDPMALGYETPRASAMGLAARNGRAAVAGWDTVEILERVEGVSSAELQASTQVWFAPNEPLPELARFSNLGLFDLEVQLTGISPGWAWSMESLTVPPASFASVSLTPPAEMITSGQLSFTTNDPDEPDGKIMLLAADHGVGTEHDDFTMLGFSWPSSEMVDHSLSEHRGEVVVLAYFALF